MNLRLDQLLNRLREDTERILAAIDEDPLSIKRTSGELVLANASQLLYTPQVEHQLFAKGIVYRRDPYRLVSLPLIKIYNFGERDVTVHDLLSIAGEPDVRLRFLRKMDGSLIQVFRAEGRLWFTTRGMLDSAALRAKDVSEEGVESFDYLGEARRLAEARYPSLFAQDEYLEGKTLLFELIHPRARVVTNYGDWSDLILLTVFDHQRFAYLSHDEVARLAERFELTMVESLAPQGDHLADQIQHLLQSWSGTDEEGSVLSFETPSEVVYRVKLKSPEYLQLMRLMAFCTYERTVEFVDQRPHVRTWDDLRSALQELGKDRVPEEVLSFYREHWERFQTYLSQLERLRAWAEIECRRIQSEVECRGADPRERRRAFAEKATQMPLPGLLFAALDGRLDQAKMRKIIRDDEEAREALAAIDC